MRILTVPGVFRPISDSLMLAQAVRGWSRPGIRALDLFTGSGVIAIAAARGGAESWAVDVSRRAVACASANALLNGVRIRARRGDMFAPLGDRRFDLIAANPPYVPGIAAARARGGARAWEAGGDGRELLDRFLSEAPSRLAPGGRLAVVHSSIVGIDETRARMADAGLEARVVAAEDGDLGPLMRDRLGDLERNGLIAHGERRERVAVIEGIAPGVVPRRAEPAMSSA
jgi:release factor glutamine methyltransferase